MPRKKTRPTAAAPTTDDLTIGLVNAPRGTWHTGPARAQLADHLRAAYTGGQTIRSLATDHGMSYAKIHKLLTQDIAGTLTTPPKLRPRGGYHRA
jgi:hypothetical protein